MVPLKKKRRFFHKRILVFDLEVKNLSDFLKNLTNLSRLPKILFIRKKEFGRMKVLYITSM